MRGIGPNKSIEIGFGFPAEMELVRLCPSAVATY